VPKTEQ